jgi:predicted TIM-barrel fold metal-dependent hydrolase
MVKKMIIDVHAHLGEDCVFDESQNEEQLLAAYDACGVDKAIIQPFVCRPYIEDTRAIHDRIYKMTRDNPGRIYGLASINPHFCPEEYEREAVRCIRELGFLGLKITTIGHAVSPSSKDGMHVFEMAQALNVPVMIHTGIGLPFADPANAWRAIEAFPHVRTILAHAGSNLMQEQAIMLAKKYDNVYLEPSWMPGVCITGMVKTVGAGRILFSSDQCGNLPVAIETFKLSIPDKNDLQMVMSGTARQLFGL